MSNDTFSLSSQQHLLQGTLYFIIVLAPYYATPHNLHVKPHKDVSAKELSVPFSGDTVEIDIN